MLLPDNDTPLLTVEALARARQTVRSIQWLNPEVALEPLKLNFPRLQLGRANSCGVQVDFVGVSRAHAEFYREGPIYAVRDLGSTNGTFVNGRGVQHSALSDGDVVRFGDLVGVVGREAPALDSPTSRAPSEYVFGAGLSKVLTELVTVAPSQLPVVLVGETGVGKECIAKALHTWSGRAGRLHALNCAALPVHLAEAELFGHAKGAFTGADRATDGYFRAANGSTLLLDELQELPAAVQGKLLRVLQESEVSPVGETRTIPVDVRIISACQRPLADLVAEGRLRRDLAERLSGVTVEIPPLRLRRVDIASLFHHFLNRYSGGRSPNVEARLLEDVLLRPWLGNVRELEFWTRRLLLQHGDASLLRLEVGDQIRGNDAPKPERAAASDTSRDDHDRVRLAAALEQHAGNVSRSARAAGISRQRAYRLLAGRSVQTFVSALTKSSE